MAAQVCLAVGVATEVGIEDVGVVWVVKREGEGWGRVAEEAGAGHIGQGWTFFE